GELRCVGRGVWGVCVCFFFSSRRRHTILVSDWSSEVCSSDLPAAAGGAALDPEERAHRRLAQAGERALPEPRERERRADRVDRRSEERRVGKEGGARWAGDG